MDFVKKQAVGFYFTLLTVVATIASLVLYLINCKTQYFSNIGINNGIIVLLILVSIVEIAYIVGSNKSNINQYFEVLPIIGGILLMIAFVLFLNARVSSIATILSFQKNAQTMSDLSSAIAAMICCFVAALLNMVGAFFKAVK